MSFYPPAVSEKFHTPRRAGEAGHANAAGAGATFVCGAVLRFTLRIDKSSKAITDARFRTDGCGFLIAAADTLAEKIIGRKLVELHGLDKGVLRKQIGDELGEFPPERNHCLELTLETLQSAFDDFRAAQLKEWTGEKALICTCFGVSEDMIEKLVAENNLQTVKEVTDICNAGGGCGSCQILIQEIIDSREFEKIFSG